MSDINDKLYTAAQVRGLDYAAIHEFDIAGYELMCRAGKAVLDASCENFPDTSHWLIMCGPGNNGGDGYVLARLAAATGMDVTVCAMSDPQKLRGDASTAFEDWCEAGGDTLPWGQLNAHATVPDCDLVFDALLGTGIERDIEGDFKDAIGFINALNCPVIAIDIPSGLNADTGVVMGAAVRAQLSVSFVGKKRGMFTADGRDYCGQHVFDDLGIPLNSAEFVPQINTGQQAGSSPGADAVGQLLSADFLSSVLKPRINNSHKGSYGEVLTVGGAKGMSGAVLLCGEAALRSGAGKVRLLTDPDHASWINLSRPELMVTAVSGGDDLSDWLQAPRVLAVGPGLGAGDWSQSLVKTCLASGLTMVMDADALNLLAALNIQADELPKAAVVLTPHPAEAARLLGISTAEIQQDRIGCAQTIAEQFQATVVLKGSGSVIACPDGEYAICPYGNPGMATAGSGDVLTGIIAALLAKGLGCREAACAGVLAHALAGDLAAQRLGEMAMLAGDIIGQLQHVWQDACKPAACRYNTVGNNRGGN